MKINFLYIDDNLDSEISEFFFKLEIPGVEKEYKELSFNVEEDSYETLLKNEKLKEADIILIDSRLYENQNAGEEKFSGEEFQLLVNYYFPFKDVLIISNNGKNDMLGILGKYNSDNYNDFQEFYDENWKPKIDKIIKDRVIIENRLKKIEENEAVQQITLEKISDSVSGQLKYDTLTDFKIDELIAKFNEFEEKYPNE